MLGKKEVDSMDRPGDLNTIVGKGTYFEGTLKVQSSVRVDGQVKGRIASTESLIIGKEGEVEGEVTVKSAIIGGKVKGKVHASGKVVLETRSVFHGELKTAKLVIDEGAVFEGVCSMGHTDSGSSGIPKPLIGAPDKKKEPLKPR